MTTNATVSPTHPQVTDDGEPVDVAIIGAGLSGLSCAKKLSAGGRSLRLFEASDRVGGRVRTDVVDGFHLDHGFQVLLTAYPACRELLDYGALRLRPFDPGALVRHGGGFSRLGDPWRRPTQTLSTLMSPVGSFGDKLRMAKARVDAGRGSLSDLYHREASTTERRLRDIGFGESMINDFFRPFLGGVFLDESLQTSSRMFEFVFRMFSKGTIAIPADGMAAIPRQLADSLPRGSLQLNASVTDVEHGDQGSRLRMSDGSWVNARCLVVATESNAAARLLGSEALSTQWNQATTLYYAAPRSPRGEKMLMLRGDETGPIQTAVVLSDVAAEYGSGDRALISVSVSESIQDAGHGELDQAIRTQAAQWFGPQVDQWEHLRTYRVPFALPRLALDPVERPIEGADIEGSNLPSHVFVCGDHRETASIQGAMNSGMRVAEKVLARY